MSRGAAARLLSASLSGSKINDSGYIDGRKAVIIWGRTGRREYTKQVDLKKKTRTVNIGKLSDNDISL